MPVSLFNQTNDKIGSEEPKWLSMAEIAVLTPREKEVFHWVVEGKSNADIGGILEISPRTVEKHCESIFRKLGIENRYAAIVLALTGRRSLEPSLPAR